MKIFYSKSKLQVYSKAALTQLAQIFFLKSINDTLLLYIEIYMLLPQLLHIDKIEAKLSFPLDRRVNDINNTQLLQIDKSWQQLVVVLSKSPTNMLQLSHSASPSLISKMLS